MGPAHSFEELGELRVRLEGMILKPSMVIDGKKARKASVDEVAERTIKVLKRTVPAAVPGIAFLSGGQSTEEATAHLSAMNAAHDLPWKLTFSYGRALQQEALNAWGGKSENVAPVSAPSPIAPRCAASPPREAGRRTSKRQPKRQNSQRERGEAR